MHIDQDTKFCIFFLFIICIKICLFEIAWPTLLYCTTFLERDLILWTLTPLIIAVCRLLDFDQMWFESKDHRNYKEKKEILTKTDIFIYGGRTWKGPKPLGRNHWGSNPKRAETSGNPPVGIAIFTGEDSQSEWMKRDESNRVYWFQTRFLSLVYL